MLSFSKLDFFDDEYDDDGSGSGSPGTCDVPFCSVNYVGSVSLVGSVVFVLNGIASTGDFVSLVLCVPKGVESKGG